MRRAGLLRQPDRIGVHMRDHQQRAGLRIGDDRGDKARGVEANAAIMAPKVDENFKLWGGLGQYLWPNPYYLATWDREKDALKSWLSLRTAWMDKAVKEWSCTAHAVSEAPAEVGVEADGDPRLGKGPGMTPEEEQKFRVPERADYHIKKEP